jgi:hypothetical protein
MIKRIISLLFVVLFVSACSFYRINSEDSSTELYPSKASADDVVYLETVDRPHEVIGTVTVNTEHRQSREEIIQKMKREAAILGADAITDLQPVAGKNKRVTVRANFSATIVVFK